jgi:hypothetical protein
LFEPPVKLCRISKFVPFVLMLKMEPDPPLPPL